MIFDFRAFLGESFHGHRQSAEELLERMDGLGIDAALVCPLKPLSYDLQSANQSLARAIAPHRDRLFGSARIDPWQPDRLAHFQQALEAGSRALYLNPWEEQYPADMPGLDEIISEAERWKLPVVVETGYPWFCEALKVGRLAQRWPETAFVMSNGGQINISGLGQADATLALRRASNLHLDTAGVYRQDFIEETVQEFGCQRVLFGSGSPYFDQRYEVLRVVKANVAADERQAMQSGNALRLLRLSEIST